MTEDRFEQLKLKYQSVMNFMQSQNVQLQNLNLQDNKLFIRGIAPSQDVKNKVWDQIKLALTTMRPPKSPQKGQVLDPCWTLKLKDAGIGCPALSSLSIPAISHSRKSSRQDPTVTALREGFPERRLARDCHYSEYATHQMELGKR